MKERTDEDILMYTLTQTKHNLLSETTQWGLKQPLEVTERFKFRSKLKITACSCNLCTRMAFQSVTQVALQARVRARAWWRGVRTSPGAHPHRQRDGSKCVCVGMQQSCYWIHSKQQYPAGRFATEIHFWHWSHWVAVCDKWPGASGIQSNIM